MRDQKGFTLWLTGLSGAGKTTLAALLANRLRIRGISVEILDGDEVRTNLSSDLGFSKEDRNANVRRIGFVCRLLSRNGVVTIAAAISPYRTGREEVRWAIEQEGVKFVEVFVQCPVAVLVERDVKGLYRRALAGEIKEFTGISDPYEEPLSPEVVVETDRESIDASVSKILLHLEQHGLIEAVDLGRLHPEGAMFIASEAEGLPHSARSARSIARDRQKVSTPLGMPRLVVLFAFSVALLTLHS